MVILLQIVQKYLFWDFGFSPSFFVFFFSLQPEPRGILKHWNHSFYPGIGIELRLNPLTIFVLPMSRDIGWQTILGTLFITPMEQICKNFIHKKNLFLLVIHLCFKKIVVVNVLFWILSKIWKCCFSITVLVPTYCLNFASLLQEEKNAGISYPRLQRRTLLSPSLYRGHSLDCSYLWGTTLSPPNTGVPQVELLRAPSMKWNIKYLIVRFRRYYF